MAEDGGVAETEFFDDEIISEILARLSVKSLMRFRCVSKSWSALISDPYFTKMHFRYSGMGITESTSRLLYSLNPPQSLDYEALKDLKDHSDGYFANSELDFPVLSYPRIVGSCNGLVLILTNKLLGFDFILWNPCTDYYTMLTRTKLPDCHPTRETHSFCGFGYDSATDDYKVVMGTRMSVDETTVHVLALKTSSWKVLPMTSFLNISGRGFLLNGALHWLAGDVWSGRTILSFDLVEEKFHDTIPLPDADIEFHGLRVVRNCLCVFNHLATRLSQYG